ncbi:ABC-type transport system protein permease component [Candidatus Scalindua japonica]|uniref:ABC-type transport system protein permease component n=1 Tax=Candidatus Scalindua japonica TaxID=1284222 RepID=A0A286TZ05_9BACT|nr:ABC-type transport system protein permease component [Candidatus Scalindua japonica]
MAIHFKGRLDVSNAALLIKEFNTLLRTRKPDSLVIDLEKLNDLDDYGVSVLVELKKIMGNMRGNYSLVNIPERVNEILTMHNFDVLGQQSITAHKTSYNLFANLGNSVFNVGNEIRYILTFLGDTCFSFLRFLRSPGSLRFNDTIENMKRVGLDALPIVSLISFLLGLIMAFMSSVQLQQFGANIYVASLVGISMTRELGPIMTAIIVAGRSGSSFAAEIGTMKISEEVDALSTMNINPNFFLVLPRMFAACLVVPILTLFSDLFAIAGGLLVGVTMLDLTVSGYTNQTINTLTLFDVFWGVFKSGIFALLISWTGCLKGFQVKGGASGVGKATTSAVVSSIFLIVLSDSLLVVILRYWNG